MVASFIVKATKHQSRWTMGKVGIASNSGSIANLLYAPEPAWHAAMRTLVLSSGSLPLSVKRGGWVRQLLNFCSSKSVDARLIH